MSRIHYLLLALAGIATIEVSPAEACSYGEGGPLIVQPAAGQADVPLNARVVAEYGVNPFRGTSNGPEDLTLERVGADAGSVVVPVSYEELEHSAAIPGRVRLVPAAPLEPGTTYILRHPAAAHWRDGGVLSDFTTGSGEDHSPPAAPASFAFRVATSDFPDAGQNLYCNPDVRARAISAELPGSASGDDALYFARIGDAGVFSGERGSWLQSGRSPGWPAGLVTCDPYRRADFHWTVAEGTHQVEVWTEDVAGNRSAPITVELHADCSSVDPGGGDGDGPPVDRGPGSFGCQSTRGGGGLLVLPAGLALVLLLRQRARRAAR
jgi:hypothetical protein